MTDKSAARLLRLISILFIAGILAFLALSGAVTLLRKPAGVSYYENRNLTALPEPEGTDLADGSWFTALNGYLLDRTFGRNALLRIETFLDLRLLRRPVVNEVVVRDEVLLDWQDFWGYDEALMARLAEDAAERIAGHARVTEQYGGKYYYVAVPHQALAYAEEYPDYLQSHEDYYQLVEVLMLNALEARDVAFLDMWAVFRSEGSLRAISSRVDNHFNIRGALETYQRLMARIEADLRSGATAMTEDDYRIEWLPNRYEGSRTRKLFGLPASDEKLGIVIPRDTPAFTRRDISSHMEEARTDEPIYALPETAEEPVSYDLYMGGDWGLTVIETGRPEKPSILIYGDSFTNCVECVIWHDFDTMISVDLRLYDAETLDALIERYRPDVVVCIRDYEALLTAGGNGQ